MNTICESCKHKQEYDNICFHGYNQITGRKILHSDGRTGICERFSKMLKKMRGELK
jgi:hypothetical protein